MPKTHGSGFPCYFWLSFFPLRLFLFRAPWVVTADEGEGRRGANPRWKRVDPDSEPGHTRGAWALQVLPPVPAAGRAGSRFCPQSVPAAAKKREKRERERWRGERERELGCRARGGAGGCGECEVCSAPRQFASSASLPSPPLGGRGERPRVFAHPGPSLGRGSQPSSSALHFGGPVGSLLSLAWVSPLPPPARSAGYFYPPLVQRCFPGGFWGGDSKSGV